MARANEKELNFNTDEIETEQLLDLFQANDESEDTDYVNILDYCIDLDAIQEIDDDKFNFMEV